MVLALVLAQLPVTSGDRAVPPAPLDIGEYYQLASAYLEGEPDRAVRDLMARPINSIDDVRAMVRRDWSYDVRYAAAVLETEAGFASGSLNVLKARLNLAKTWIVNADPTRFKVPDTFRPRWYVTVGRKFLASAVADGALELLEKARDLYPDDPEVLLIYGTTRETMAYVVDGSPTAEALAAGRAPVIYWSNPARQSALTDARRALRRALELAPASVEAAVRLAQVSIALKDDRAARPLLERVLAGSPAPLYEYTAALLLGDLLSRTGQLEAAVQLYSRAQSAVPGAQSPYIAHAHALRSAGQYDAAAAVVSTMLSRSVRTADPWQMYAKGFDPEAADLRRLRAYMR